MLKKFTSLSILFSSIVMSVSGVAVYMSPPCHIAGFSSWKFLYLNKKLWMALHINSGLLFMIFFVFHFFFNMKLIEKYIIPQKKFSLKGFLPLCASAVLFLYMMCSSIYNLTPFDKVIKLGRSFKFKEMKAYGHLPPPYGKALYIPLNKAAFMLGTNADEICSTLKNAGLKPPKPHQSLQEISQENNVSTGFILDILNNSLTAGN